MKKRKRSQRQQVKRNASSWLDLLTTPSKQTRRPWTFERLEERNFFSATPFSGLANVPLYAISNSTAEGQQIIDAIQQSWYAQSGAGSGGQAQSSTGQEGRFAPYALPTDPYLSYQWHLFNVGQVVNPGQFQDLYGVPGQDINVIPAWDQGYSGAGVTVAVVDDGTQLDHPDLIGNLLPGYDAIRNRPGGGPVGADPHGTAVAGLIGAVANAQGGVGVAFGSTIYPIRFLGVGSNEQTFLNAIAANGTPIDVYNHSWGPSFDFYGRSVAGPTMNEFIALTNSARLGRNGLGSIHVFASGNSAEGLHSAGSNGYVNSRYTIGVGIVDHDGQVLNADGTSTEYGEMAPSVLIVAPSASGPTDIINNFATGSGIFTTDRTAPNQGYNLPPLPSGLDLDIDLFPDDDYTSRFGGTSAAAPLVSGVIALMLEANPNLSYRDVQEILVRSARQNDDLDESWITNLVPLFRDPFQHSSFPSNYPVDPMDPFYPSDESQWNDEIVYQLVSQMPVEAAMQASTGNVPSANSNFSVTAMAGQLWDGWVGNNLTVAFRTEHDGMPGAEAQIIEGKLLVTVTGDGVTWGDIEAAVEMLGITQNPASVKWFEMTVGSPSALFAPTDEAIQAPLTGGVDARGVDSALQLNPLYQGYHPIADPITNPEPKSLFTNGAGFTVSHGRGGNSEYGYAHGVVNAGLAVELAKQWHLKDQNLPPEKTYLMSRGGGIRLRAAQVTDEMSGEYVIPGALTFSTEGFADYFNEFFKEPTIVEGDLMAMPPTLDSIDPMSLPFHGDDPPVNTRGSFDRFDVPAIDPVTGASNLMSMEWVEVHLTISGDADAMNYLKITLVSPDGTHSELTQNQYRPEDITRSFQSIATGGVFTGLPDSITAVDENGTNSDTLDWVYSTNRIWGERSDSKPIFDEYGNIVDFKGWELHFENYSGSDLMTSNIQVAFHGSPIGSPAGPVERVMGKVGVDAGRYIQASDQIVGANDGDFNFDRFVTTTSPNSHAFTTSSIFLGGNTPFGEHEILIADQFQEQFAGNITVYAIDNNPSSTSYGLRVAEFLTGYDGNYYFDLPEGEYKIGIEDPLGRSALDNVDGHRDFDNEWIVTIDTSDDFFRTAGEIDAISGKLNLFDDLNFLLDPGTVPAGEVVFTGQVIGDLDGDGAQDAVDVGVFNIPVYADLNHTGQFEIGEPVTLTDVDGNYELHVPTGTPNTFSIGVIAPTAWSTTTPVSKFHLEYSLPGEQTDNLKFLINPPSTPSNEGNGYIFGLIFSDKNGDGVQQGNEAGLAGRTVFIDTDKDGMLDAGEISTLTTASGAYQFGEVLLGTVRIDVLVNEPFKLTSPIQDEETGEGWIEFTLVAGQVVRDVNFGVQNQAINDYGDLVGAGFQTGSAASFVSLGVHLGSGVDAEIRPKNLILQGTEYVEDQNLHGIGDDQNEHESSFDDEDGVVLVGGVLRPGSNLLEITVGGIGFYLQGWIDFNDNGKFDPEPQFGEQVFTNLDINPGTHQLVINVPTSLVAGEVAARFRLGTINQTFSSSDLFGEIEDYLFDTAVPALGDYNADSVIDQEDYNVWKSTFGSTVDLRADGNKNGIVDIGDFTVWRRAMSDGGDGGGGAAAVAMAPPLPQVESVQPGPVVQTAAIATQLVLLGSAPAEDAPVTGGGAASLAPSESAAESGVADVSSGGSTSFVEFSQLQFTSIVHHTPLAMPSQSIGAESADLAMLLLATGYFQGQQLGSADSAGDDAEMLDGDGQRDGELDLAIAAVFEDEVDWRYAL